MLRDSRAFVLALGAYALFYTAFFLRSLLTGNLIAPSDSLDFGVAAYLSSPALWTEGMYSGYPIAADPQSLTWYPVLHLFRAFRLDWNGFLISAFVIASATSFLFVRRVTGSTLAGVFSGFVYGFSAVMLGHIGHFNQIHAAAWVPLALYGFQVIRHGEGPRGGLVAAGAMAMMWLAGHPQVPVYTAYLSGALVAGGLLIDRPPRALAFARLGWSAFGVLAGLAIAAVAILPMVELGELSRRAESNWELYTSKALPPWQLLGIALPFAFGGMWSNGEMPVPYFGLGGPAENTGYVGLLPLVLAVAAPFVLQTHRREARLWMAVTIVAVLLCLGAATPLGRLFFYAPGYASFRVPARHLFVVSICLAGLSGLGFAELTRTRDGWGRLALSIGAVLVVVSLLLTAFVLLTPEVRGLVSDDGVYRTWVVQWPVVLGGLLLSCAFIGIALGARPAALTSCALLLIGVQVLDLTMVHYRMPGQRLEYADIERSEASPQPRVAALRDELRRSGRRALASDGSRNPFLLPNLTRPWGVPSATGTGSLGIERYVDVMGMGGPGDVYPETMSAAHQGADLMSVGYALVPSGSRVAEDMRQQAGRWSAVEDLQYYEHDPGTRYTLFRNERARPRAWCVPGVVHATPDEILAAIRIGHLPGGQGVFDPAQVALAEPGVLPDWTRGSAGTPADVTVELEPQPRYLIRTATPCLLVMSEVFYPWWRASIDDRDADIVRVNHTMIGLPLPPGQHVVRLRITSTSVWLGGGVTVAGLAVCALLLVGGMRRSGRRRT
jgi:hypothetical protein